MLIQLNIKNFALIEDLSMDFEEGFNILSGETGAGKSIMIDAIDFVLGGKFSKSLIRTGTDKTYVEGIFTIDNESITKVLDEYEIEYDDTIIISRESHINGKNLIRINGKSFITSILKKIGCKLLDIHGQHANTELLNRSSHIIQLDEYIGEELKEPLALYLNEKRKYTEVQNEILRITGNTDREKLLDYLKFQIEDIEKAKLKENEEIELKEQFNILSNAEKINNGLHISYEMLNGNEDGGVLNLLSKVISELGAIENHFDKIKKNKESIEGAFYTLEENAREIRDMCEEIIYDENTLEKVNSRIYELNMYKKKYASEFVNSDEGIKEVLKYYEKIKKEYDEIVNSENIINELKEKEKEILEKMKERAETVHNIREKYAEKLQSEILNELTFVGLEKSRMNIEVAKKDEFNERGFDEVTFFISTNPGEPLMPLEKVLSGGELSRIMLGLKCVFAEKDKIPTLIFDEIDTGISGAVAQRVGEKMYQLSRTHQVLCITHLPQIAILSDHHYFISKNVIDDKTYTQVKALGAEEKELEICKMLCGNDITDAVINNVKEMISLSNIKKIEINNKK